MTSDSIEVELIVPREARLGENIPATIRLANRSSGRVTLYLRGKDIVFDLTALDAAGDTVWQRLHDQVVPAIVQVRELAPGESFELRGSWDQRSNAGARVAPGEYTLVGSILRDEPMPFNTPPVTVRIVSPGTSSD